MKRTCREVNDPFKDLTEEEFKRLFRLNKEICRIFIDTLMPYMQERVQPHGISAEIKILCAVRFFATGSYQRSVSQDLFVAMSQSSLCRYIHEVSEAIVVNLANNYIKFPEEQERNSIKSQFFNKFGMPGVIGLIDCTHVSILRPSTNVEQAYYAVRKASHTKNVQIVCDFDLRIRSIYPRFGGSSHDSFIWNGCGLRAMLQDEHAARPKNSWLLGDSGYGQQPWLFTPIRNTHNEREERYNAAHQKARHPIERCIGVLKSRFRCLCKQRVLMYSPVKSGKIIIACAVLHNIMIEHNYPLPDFLEDEDEAGDHNDVIDGIVAENANDIRTRIINTYF